MVHPLNATLVSASDDPLFSPSKTSQSSRTSTPDPLSRTSSPTPSSSSPLDVNINTPIRRTAKPTTTATNNSIFGDIDVSKLSSNGVYNTTGNRTNTTLRTTTLRSNRPLEQDEEDLFGGSGRFRAKVQSKATHVISKIIEPRAEPTPVTEQAEPVIPHYAPPVVVSTPSSPPTTTTGGEEKSSSSFFASASRFFKSSSHGNSTKNSSAASSVSNVSIKSDTPVTPPSRQPTPPARQTPPQQQKQPRKMAAPPLPPRNIPIEKEEEEEEEDLSSHHVIEDEATRAFADDVISFKANYTPDYTSLSNELNGMDSLRIDNKRLLPSASTPTTVRADVDDPWFDNSRLALTGTIEPSVSSPLHKVSVQDIEPQKRSAFADLINSWNTGQTKFESVQEEEDHEQFFSHVAAEQRDIGFGGITNVEEEDDEDTMKTSISVVWDNDEENPWN
ncbi:hypothetical protein HPULCUR_007550 [Helicostylum pulchrum]|uniref:Uncharacterized protein n=1 Tax=Helicostylum pulchrum TaxID=562976 RepID=A0ABP9Y5U2_9FUNG